MFISFSMFIGLIIVTIIMIVLIIYLTFTGSNYSPRHNNSHQAEKITKERVVPNDLTMPEQPNDLTQRRSNYQDNLTHEPDIKTHYYHESGSEEIFEEDDSLHVLPYPKDDDFS